MKGAQDFSGVFAALTTPFASDGAVSIENLKFNLESYNRTALAGYVVLGSTGESVLLTDLEMAAVLEAARESAGSGKKLLAGTGAESTQETIERTKRAGKMGYDAALVKTPYYYKPAYKAAVLIEHYRRVADASPIPVFLYSVPIFTGLALEAPEVTALASHPNILGIKDSSGNVQRISEMIDGAGAEFQVLVGAAGTVLPCLTMGARGAILALACAVPEKCAELFEHFQAGRRKEARELQKLLARLSRVVMSENGIAGVKHVMDRRGMRGGIPRLPLPALTDQQKSSVDEVLSTLEPVAARG